MSKLDRFLVSDNFFSIWRDATVSVLPRCLSDHCPLLLKVETLDFGPKPFKIFDSWLEKEGFSEVVNASWSSSSLISGTLVVILRKRLHKLKQDIKSWLRKECEKVSSKKSFIIKELDSWDKKAEEGSLSYSDRINREALTFELENILHSENMDMIQKSISKWAVEGDENSKFFHSFMNNR